VVCEIDLPAPARRPIEEHGVDALLHPDGPPPALFSLVGDVLGSTFDDALPDAAARVTDIRERAARFLPAVRDARVRSMRTCPRPQSADGRPWIGPLRDDLHVCAGHGAWGVSLGPASGQLAAEVILNRATVPAALAAARPVP
jgi:glycine/D-amino acid oxidase-like deaminating enzyme